MNRATFGSVLAIALAIALPFRLADLGLRPMHHDEANQAIKFGRLLETGEYRYDRSDHHGPSLYYLTLPVAWMRGQTTLASLDETTLRSVPAVFGAGLILLLPLAVGGLTRPAIASAALLSAVSPALTYYSRDYVQESLFAFFALAFVMSLGRYLAGPRLSWAVGAGACAGLMYSTKETSLIVIPCAVAAAVVAARWSKLAHPVRAAHLVAGLAAGSVIALAFYSSFFSHPAALSDAMPAFDSYATRGLEPGLHTHPWYYYLQILSWFRSGRLVWTEGLVLLLALVGMVASTRSSAGFWPRYVGLYALITASAFSIVPYKTPWNLLPFYIGFVLMAGVGVVTLVERTPGRVFRGLVLAGLAVAACQLGLQDWRANFRYPADPRNPYAYAQTSTDFRRLVTRVTDLAAVHPEGSAMLVKVVAGPHEQWPLPWYLRRMTRVGYWISAGEAGPVEDAPVIVASRENTAALDAALGDRYISEFYGLRPNVLLTVYIERQLWDQFLTSRQRAR